MSLLRNQTKWTPHHLNEVKLQGHFSGNKPSISRSWASFILVPQALCSEKVSCRNFRLRTEKTQCDEALADFGCNYKELYWLMGERSQSVWSIFTYRYFFTMKVKFPLSLSMIRWREPDDSTRLSWYQLKAQKWSWTRYQIRHLKLHRHTSTNTSKNMSVTAAAVAFAIAIEIASRENKSDITRIKELPS